MQTEEDALQPAEPGAPAGPIGTLLAWETGMGKTVVTIQLVCLTYKEGPTLILCPNIEIALQWRSEIEKFSRGLSVLVYHSVDTNSTEYKKDCAEIQKYDIVLATYHQARSQHDYLTRAQRGELPLAQTKEYPFFRCRWHRIVGDEAHQLRNPAGAAAAACCALPRRVALALTATPLQNHPCDLQPLLRFLGRECPGLGRVRDFRALGAARFAVPGGEARSFEEIFRECVIHRRKVSRDGVPCIGLPRRHDHSPMRVVLDAALAALYHYILTWHVHKCVLDKFVRLRQVCLDPRLLLRPLSDDGEELAREAEGQDMRHVVEEVSQSWSSASIHAQAAEGADSLDIRRLPQRVRPLRHLFKADYVPPVIQTALETLEKIRRRSRGQDKTIVYSTFRGPLETLSTHLRGLNVGHVTYNGKTTATERAAALERIATDPACKVLLMTIQSGGMGLNVTACNHVVFLEPWWNPYLEEQAVGRVYRIGQEKPVHVYRVLVEDTVQTADVVPIQSEKRKHIDSLLKLVEIL
ncbi:DEAD/DEAH box helicase [Phanerochaete sordida]|uniref:DEAD/DEAH box helicase n=1 Tax=Phanerochaete sordida TaxID=48140 RepID=A0A9P3LHZ4_9APHY|nr:DEAD/DEAH box helicase [Phanerochaete sordida]